MKKIYTIFSCLLIIAFAGCKEEMEHDPNKEGLEFIHFITSGSFLVDKDAKAIDVEVGITSVSSTDRTYNIKVSEASTAIEGVDYIMTSRTVTIPAGKYIGNITIEPLYETLNQEETVSLILILDVEESLINPAGAYGNTTVISMTYDFDVDMDYLVGDWLQSDYDPTGGFDDGGWIVTISRKSDNEIYISNFWDGGCTIEAEVDFEEGTISVKEGQTIYVHSDYGNISMGRLYYSDGYWTNEEAIPGSISALGIRIQSWAANIPQGYFGLYSYSFLEKKK